MKKQNQAITKAGSFGFAFFIVIELPISAILSQYQAPEIS
jgi:hypothetical protein